MIESILNVKSVFCPCHLLPAVKLTLLKAVLYKD